MSLWDICRHGIKWKEKKNLQLIVESNRENTHWRISAHGWRFDIASHWWKRYSEWMLMILFVENRKWPQNVYTDFDFAVCSVIRGSQDCHCELIFIIETKWQMKAGWWIGIINYWEKKNNLKKSVASHLVSYCWGISLSILTVASIHGWVNQLVSCRLTHYPMMLTWCWCLQKPHVERKMILLAPGTRITNHNIFPTFIACILKQWKVGDVILGYTVYYSIHHISITI